GAECFNAPLGIDLHETGVDFRGAARDYRTSLGALRRADHPAARLDDSGLFGGNFRDRVSKKILVVQVDLRDHRNLWLQDVRRVESPAHADFIDREINGTPREGAVGHRGHAFEICGMSGKFARGEKGFDRGLYARKVGGKSVIGNRLTVELNTFVDTFQMRRSEEACRKSRGAQDR